MEFLLLIALVAGAFVTYYLMRWRRATRRRRLFSSPLPKGWEALLEQRLSIYRGLPTPFRRQLHGLINVFVDEKQFVGCNGLKITDEMRVVIAAQACLLLLNRDTDVYSGFKTIYLYPGTYVAREKYYDGLVEFEGDDIRAGEAWHRGPVVLSWEDVCASFEPGPDSFNVVLHEFAHKLDEENESYDGLPVLGDPAQRESWAKVLSQEFESLRERASRGERGVVDEYGAESPAEFFAVVTEVFFEKPRELHHRHPALYGELRKFYKLDPKRWAVDL